jgi:ubiquinone biosynthesis accessory factor UbiJ
MFPISVLPDPGRPAVRALNALLRREDWARARLARHAGKTVRLVVGALKLGLTIDSEGYAETADPAVVPDVTLTADPAKFSVARLFQGGAEQADPAAVARARADAIADMTHISGDAGLAQVVAELAAQLRWDIEDDLARLVGDIPAARLVGGVRALSAGLRGAAGRLGNNLVEYLSQERPVLTPRPLLEDSRADIARAHAAIEALQARMTALRTRVERLDVQAGNETRGETRNGGPANRGNGGA